MNTPDIDIERLREAVANAVVYDSRDNVRHEPGRAVATSSALKAAARFLVSLADQDGELWMLPEGGKTDDLVALYGALVGGHFYDDYDEATRLTGVLSDYLRSRVRVWPKIPVESEDRQ